MRRTGEKQLGQALVEFSIVLPIAFVLLVGLFDLGRVVWAADVTAHAASEAARFAIVRGASTLRNCPIGPPAGSVLVPAPTADCPYPSPSKQSIVDHALEAASTVGGTVAAEACYGSGCQGDTDQAGAVNSRGTELTVTVSADLDLVTTSILGPILGRSSYAITNTATMEINN
jgi:hypothetical protein